jgi:hypothetical protein
VKNPYTEIKEEKASLISVESFLQCQRMCVLVEMESVL